MIDHTQELVQQYDVRMASIHQSAHSLSGGNLQKLILAREITASPKFAVVMHPTRGLDVGAIEFVHSQLLEARRQGAAILLISSELEEAGANPPEAYYDMLKSTLGRYYGVGEVISKSIPLLLIAAGVAIGFYGGQTNLGGDGQFYLGAITAAWTGLLFTGMPWPLVFVLSWAAAALAGGAWGAVAGVLKAYLNTSEIIITIMLNYVSVLFVSFLVHGPLKEKGGFIPQTATLPEDLQLPIILEGTRAHAGILVALIALLILWFVIHKTVLGYRIRAVGQGLAGARYAGIHCGRYITLSLFLSGALAGLAGAIEVFGIHHRVLEGISSDFGFTAVIVALLGRLKPLGILASALLLSGLVVGANAMQVSQGVPVSVVLMLESMIVAFVLLGESYRQTAAR